MCNIRNLLKSIFIVILLASLSGCGGDSDCIDADDFGFTTVDISSRYNKEGDIRGEREEQITPWIDKNLELNGKILVITVKNWSMIREANTPRQLSAWCPWYGNKKYDQTLSPMCARLPTCVYAGNETCVNPVITNYPCLMKKGIGLYAYLARRTDANPNDNDTTKALPNGVTIHIGKQTPYEFWDILADERYGGIKYDYDGTRGLGSSRIQYVDGKLYLKIVDSYYEDNNGKYKVVIRSGVKQPGSDIFTTIRVMVQERLFGTGRSSDVEFTRNGIVRTIYQKIVTEPGFVRSVQALLILYVMITGFLFIMGSVSLTNAEVVQRVLKIAILSILINPSVSWDFFNQYLFIWMYKGSEFIVQIYTNAMANGPGDSSILSFLTSPQVIAKVSAMLFLNWMGWFFILLYLVLLVFLTFVMFNATLIYLTALIMMGLLICLAPLFIAFYLFESTKSFFDNWLKQLISYAIQIIIISAGVLFLDLIIRTQIYNTLGYGVCLRQFPNMNVGSSTLSSLASGSSAAEANLTSLFAWWFPVIKTNSTTADLRNVLIPKAHFSTTGTNANRAVFASQDLLTGTSPGSRVLSALSGTSSSSSSPSPPPSSLRPSFCEPYQCSGMRYPDLPFLDPNVPQEARMIRILRDGTKVDFWGGFILVACCFLLHHFNSTTVTIAKFLSSTTGNLGDNLSAANQAYKKISGDMINYGDKKLGISEGLKGMKEKASDSWEKNVSLRAKRIASSWHYGRLERQALRDSGRSGMGLRGDPFNTGAKSIQNKVASKYGITQQEARAFESKKDMYKAEIKKLSLDDSKQIYKSLEKGDLDKFDELLKKNDLSAEGSASLAAMRKEKALELRYKKAYVDSYKDLKLSERENVSRKSTKKQMRSFKADRNIAAFQNLKRYLSGNLLASEADQILYNDNNLMTTNEKNAQKQDRLDARARKKELNKLTISAKKDIQRFDYLAEERKRLEDLKESGFKDYASKKMKDLDDLIRWNVEDVVREGLMEDGVIKGDTYVRTEMNDREFDQMIADIKANGNQMMQDDDYIKNSDLYIDKAEDADLELERRKQYYENAIQSEVDRMYEIRDSEMEEKHSIKDVFRSATSKDGSSGEDGGGSTPGPVR